MMGLQFLLAAARRGTKPPEPTKPGSTAALYAQMYRQQEK